MNTAPSHPRIGRAGACVYIEYCTVYDADTGDVIPFSCGRQYTVVRITEHLPLLIATDSVWGRRHCTTYYQLLTPDPRLLFSLMERRMKQYLVDCSMGHAYLLTPAAVDRLIGEFTVGPVDHQSAVYPAMKSSIDGPVVAFDVTVNVYIAEAMPLAPRQYIAGVLGMVHPRCLDNFLLIYQPIPADLIVEPVNAPTLEATLTRARAWVRDNPPQMMETPMPYYKRYRSSAAARLLYEWRFYQVIAETYDRTEAGGFYTWSRQLNRASP